ncbi:MAG: DEAD/DEAH box helicase [Myxococcales bacterium]|nr:DEAD/DEAH box helicase [Myxococcales bacterium]
MTTQAQNHTTPASRVAKASIDPFAALGLSKNLCSAVVAAGYTEPTPIQQAAIPPILGERDLVASAQTGTGKTAAFALPILELITDPSLDDPRGEVRALILAPTRELAAQIGQSFETYGRFADLRTQVVFGGVKRSIHERALRVPPEILVATPGRLLDLMSTGDVDLDCVEHLVLDEADRMLDMGFIHDMRKIMAALPQDRQTLLFSATMPAEIEALAKRYMHKPARVAVAPVSATCDPISESVYFVHASDKQRALTALLADREIERGLVFTRTKHGANRVASRLDRAGIPAAAIHGNKSQSARERVLAGFKDGSIRVVVATDLASRGIDVHGLTHVFNFELPNEPEVYVHRVGRTGRANQPGAAVSLCAADERPRLAAIERLTRTKLQRLDERPLLASVPAPEHEPPRRQTPRRQPSRRSRSSGGAGGRQRQPRRRSSRR